MKALRALLMTAAALTCVAASGNNKICEDSTPTPTPTPTTPQPTTPAPTTPEATTPTTPAPTTPVPTTPPPTTPAPTTPAPTTMAPTVMPTTCAVGARNQAILGTDYFEVTGYDAAKCCARCSSAIGCTAFTHRASDGMDFCQLWSITCNILFASRAGWTTGFTIVPKRCQLLPAQTQLTGTVYTRTGSAVVEGCCIQCSLDGAKCKGYAHYAATQTCSLFSSITGQTTVTGWSSGLNY